MSQENKDKKEHKNSQMMKITMVSLLAVLLFLIEIYEIINDPANMIVIGSLGVFLLVSVYAEMLLIRKQMEGNAKEQEEAFDNVYRSEKASYLLMRKYFDQMEQKMENLSEPSELPYKELIAAQKALAKVQINRSKQNTNALLISNDRMMQRINSIQKDITELNRNNSEHHAGLSEQDQAVLSEGNKQVLEKQQEILSGLKELETSLRNEILESAGKMASMKSQQMSVPQPQIQDYEDIQPLEMDEEFSFANDDSSQLVAGASSESDLDNLLMQMDNGVSLESPELPSISEGADLQPLLADSDLSTMLGDLDNDLLQLMPEDTMQLSAAEEPALQPVVEEPDLQLQPIIEEPDLQLQPINEESDLQLQPINEESDLQLQPMIEEPDLQLQPTMEEPDLQLQSITEEDLQLQPIEEPDLQLQPVEEPDSQLQPITEEPDLQLTEEMPNLQSVVDESGLVDITEEPALQSIVDIEPQTFEESAAQSIMKSPELSPIMESEEQPEIVPGLSTKPATTEAELQAMIDQLQPRTTVLRTDEKNVSEPESSSVKSTDVENNSGEITPDRLAAMIANLGNEPILEEPEAISSEAVLEEPEAISSEAVLEEPDLKDLENVLSEPTIQESESASSESAFQESEPASLASPSSSLQPSDTTADDDELDQIMKAMDIDDILGESVEDLDIDKILEVPLTNATSNGSESDQVMNSDEIAALIANTELLSDPEPVKNSDLPDLSDPSHVMTSDEIAALIANM